MEVLGPICLLIITLVVIAVLGHAIWLALAWFFGLFTGTSGRRTAPRHTCPRCGTRLPQIDSQCLQCGWPARPLQDSASLVDLVVTSRQLDRFLARGLIDGQTHRRLMQAVSNERDRLTAPLRPVPQRPAPAPHPHAVPPPVAHQPVPARAAAKDAIIDAELVEPDQPAAPLSVDRPEPTRPPPPKPFSAVLAAFMEEKNIRWGELTGGLLIVCCSIALVISLWAQIAQRPILKFFGFTVVTGSLFGAGLYTDRRWKLPTTSRGLLIIATLLVPLNFLAIAAFSTGAAAADLITISGELVAFAVFLGLVYLAGKLLLPDWAPALTIGVLGTSAAQLLVRRFAVAVPDLSPVLLLTLAALPLACYVGAGGWMVRDLRRSSAIGEQQANRIFMLLGTLTFSVLVPLGLLVYKSGDTAWSLQRLAPLSSLLGAPGLATGLLLWSRVRDVTLFAARLVGTSIAVLSAFVLLAGIALAWPVPARVFAVALADFAILTLVGLAFRIPAAHALAVPCLVLAYLVGFHATGGRHVGWTDATGELATALFSATSGTALVPVFVLLAAVSEGLRRAGRHLDGLFYAAATGAVGLVSVALVTWYGFARPGDQPTWVYAVYAAGALWVAGHTRQVAATAAGLVLLLAALVQGLAFGRFAQMWQLPYAWQVALLAHGTIAAAIAAGLRTASEDTKRLFANPARLALLAGSTAAMGFLVPALFTQSALFLTARTVWLAALWLAAACLWNRRDLFAVFQTTLAFAAVFGATALVATRDWYMQASHPALLDPWTVAAHGIGLAMLSLAWIALRLAMRGTHLVNAPGLTSVAAQLVARPQPIVEQVSHAVALILLAALALYGAAPGVALELAPASSPLEAAPNLAAIPHAHALGAGTWLLLVVLLAVCAVRLWEHFDAWPVLGAIVILPTTPLLLAGLCESHCATASALRWLSAGALLAGSVPIWLRSQLLPYAARLGWPGLDRGTAGLAAASRSVLLPLTLVPILGITLYASAAAIVGSPVIGPGTASFFTRAGNSVSYAVPLVAAALALAGHALRERSSAYAFSAGLITNLTVTLAYLLSVVTAGKSVGGPELIRLVQYNAIASAAYALAWIAVRSWRARILEGVTTPAPGPLLQLQVLLGAAANGFLLVPAALGLFAQPGSPPVGITPVGGIWGWLALGLEAVAITWLVSWRRDRFPAEALCIGLLSLATLVACRLAEFDTGNWLAYHALLVGTAAAAWLTLIPSGVARRLSKGTNALAATFAGPRASWWATAAGGIAVVLALRATMSDAASGTTDPGAPWWSSATLVAMAVLAAAVAWQLSQRIYLYAAAALLNLAATIWWITDWWQPRFDSLVELLDVNVIALAAPAVAWLALELRVLRRAGQASQGIPAVHHLAAAFATLAVAAVVAVGLAGDVAGRPLQARVLLGWLALACAISLMTACLWDRQAKYAVAGLYLLGLTAAGMTLDQFDLQPRWMGWMGMMVLAAHSVLTSYLWSLRNRLAELAVALRIPRPALRPDAAPGLAGLLWLVPSNVLLAAVVVALAFWVILTFPEFGLRLAAATPAVAAQTVAVGLLAKGARRSLLQQTALMLGVVAAVAWGWAWLQPGGSGTVLNRAVVVMTAVAAMTALYGIGASKVLRRENEWTRAAEASVPGLTALGGAALAFILIQEFMLYAQTRSVPMDGPAIVAVAVALAGACCAALVMALVPGRDPLRLSEQGRIHYVYAAEIMLALLFLHLKLTAPWLFAAPVFRQYWPLTVMLLAFLGVGLGELFRRQNRLVLAQPLERTGAFLPLLPVLVYWTAASQVHYSVLLIVVASLYASLSVVRRSFAFGLLSALAANGALWYLLHRTERLGLLDHPQLWLIPFALSVLIAAYLNRDRLTDLQMTTVRYLSLSIIYVSSTVDIFINGVAESPWLPLVLMGLSVAGVLTGIMLRVRAFLHLGTAFLVVSLITIIWHASANLGWTWLWYVAGIVLGLAIISLFALFEMNRNDVLRVIERIKHWDP